MNLRKLVIELQVDFEMSMNERDNAHHPDWKTIRKCDRKLEEQIGGLNISIREHIFGKINSTEQEDSNRPR